MSSVTFPVAIGGDGSTVSDDDNATTGLRNGGWRTRFIPCFTNLVNIANYMVSYTAQTSTFAQPPPMGSTTPNTGAFTRVTVTGSTPPANGLYLPSANSLGFATNSTERVRIDSSGNLGIGTSSPGQKLEVAGRVAVSGSGYTVNSSVGLIGAYSGNMYVQMPTGGNFQIWKPSTDAVVTIDTSGNLGLGVTPSAWASSYKALQVGSAAGLVCDSTSSARLYANAYYDGTNLRYINSDFATQYSQYQGVHRWFTAPSGTAGNAISFTQAMTLDASGALSNVAYVKAGTYLWAAGDTSSGGIYLGSAGAGNARIGQNSYGTGTTTTYIGNAAITTSSDVRLKENIEDTKRNAIEILGNLRVVDHTWNDPTDTCENNRNSRGLWMGLIAQEAIDHIPWLVNKPLSDEDERGNPQYWHMDYGYSVPLLIKAIQELSAELNELKKRVG